MGLLFVPFLTFQANIYELGDVPFYEVFKASNICSGIHLGVKLAPWP